LKKILLFFMCIGLFGDDYVAPTYSVTYTSAILSKYYGSIIGGIFYDDWVTFQDIGIARMDKKGTTYVDLWASRPITNTAYNKNWGDEYDVVVGRSMPLAKGKVRLDIAGTYLVVNNLERINDDIATGKIRLDFPKVPHLQPYAEVYRFIEVGPKSPSGGSFIYLGLLHDQKIGGDHGPTIGFDYRYGHSLGVLGAEAGPSYHRLSISPVIPIAKKIDFVPSLVGQTAYHRHDPFKVLADRSRIFCSFALIWRIK